MKELKERTYRIQTILCDLLAIYFRMKKDKKFVSLFCIGEEAIQELYGDSTRQESIKSHDFIEVTSLETNRKMLIRTSEIKCVDELKDGTDYITTEIKENLELLYIKTKESYSEIKALLQ